MWTRCRTMWSHGRWRCSTARFDLRLRTSLQQRSPRRRRRRSRRQRSRSPCPRRRRRRPIPCCRLFRRLCPLNRHPVTLSRIRSSIYSWPPIGGTNRRHRSFVEGKVSYFAEEVGFLKRRELSLSLSQPRHFSNVVLRKIELGNSCEAIQSTDRSLEQFEEWFLLGGNLLGGWNPFVGSSSMLFCQLEHRIQC